ncbi:isochorismatase family protein [Vibrio crassostreae]|uniref:Isochorismatase hydrolase n=1 Tax=Vibrio crassostreae TaxID=246167 RepID=A0ABM9QUJ1_9VIBR|nr:isochorismatase family protein [Vibrio crassostreae]TCL29062.1 nicotinamidase-related amidase [Vibrio crassostreae]TCT51830.1 nicotinamidase-related amidase [Vibrio crassostreae]TCT60719.1 nicotinamidase-related amidase [Vibrio crassostreae]CAK1852003.1 Isochorismatase hydrolase [Vibrio crassostreae]CAK1852829.1 Isochorismatase hydrolase [Vibrio crassostreae]
MNTTTFTPENSVMLLIDHQVGTMGWVGSANLEEIKNNTVALARAAHVTKMPLILTSSMEDQAQGPLFDELINAVPEAYENRILRGGVVDSMKDENFAAAVKATGRKNIIIAGITTDVCVVYPAITAIAEGYNVQVVVDGSGSPTTLADATALRRMEKHGVTLTSTNQLIAELAQDWSTDHGSKLIQVLFEEIISKQH